MFKVFQNIYTYVYECYYDVRSVLCLMRLLCLGRRNVRFPATRGGHEVPHVMCRLSEENAPDNGQLRHHPVSLASHGQLRFRPTSCSSIIYRNP